LNDERHEFTQECRAISQLVPIDAAVSGGAAMDKLIAQGVHARKGAGEYGCGFVSSEDSAGDCLLCKTLFG
jgi:hypothetical protein